MIIQIIITQLAPYWYVLIRQTIISYEPIEQTEMEEEESTNSPPSAPANTPDGCYKLVDNSGTIKAYFNLA